MTEEFERLLRLIAAELQTVASQDSTWSTASLDARYDNAGGVLAKIRCQNVATREPISLSSTTELNLALIELDSLRSVAGETWHGIRLTVSRDGKSQVDLNYDSACHEDTSFFDS